MKFYWDKSTANCNKEFKVVAVNTEGDHIYFSEGDRTHYMFCDKMLLPCCRAMDLDLHIDAPMPDPRDPEEILKAPVLYSFKRKFGQ